MVLKHYGVPEFEPPENYDEVQLRGDHIVTFKVNLPSFNPNEADQTEMDKLLAQMLENEQQNSDKYYAHYHEKRKQR